MAYEDILAAVDAVRLMDSVRAICTGERLSNEAEVRSFDVLEKLFTDAGCRVTREALPGYVSTQPSKRAALLMKYSLTP